jgi:exonuclease VII small subunit
MAQQAAVSTTSGVETKVKDAVDNLRSAAQDLHKQIGDAVSKKSGASKADIAALAEKTKSVIQSAKATVDTQKGNVGKHLTDAVKHLEATQAHLSDSLKATGTALDTSVKKVLAEARASVQKVSEAVAEKRAANSVKKS